MLLVELPTYMKAILRFNISQVSVILILCLVDCLVTNSIFATECRVVRHSIRVVVDIQHHLE